MDAVRQLLADCKLEAVAHRNEDMLLRTKDEQPVSEALAMLKDKNVLSIPVVDAKNGQFNGVFSVSDVLRAIIAELRLEKQRQSFEASRVAITAALKKIYAHPVSKVMHSGDLWYLEGQAPSVMDAVKDMLVRRQVHHRVFTCQNLKDTAPTGILSQSDVVQLVWDHKVELADMLQKTVDQLGLCAAAANTVPVSETLLQSLVDMYRDRKTCIGVTSDKGDLIGNLSVSDLRLLTPELFDKLDEPVGCFILASRGLPVPEGKDVDWASALKAVPLHIVTPETKFEQVLTMLSVMKLHRVYVLDHKEHAIGIITLTDILRRLLPTANGDVPQEGPGGGLPHSSELPYASGAGEGEGEDAQQ